MKSIALSGAYFKYTITVLFLSILCHQVQASSSIKIMVDKSPPWNEELNTRTIFTVKSLKLKQQCGHFTPLNDSSILYTMAKGGGSTDSSGQHQDKPAAPLKSGLSMADMKIRKTTKN